MNRTETKNSGSDIAGKHLSPLAAWALSFGYAVGWGAFVISSSEFLPMAGPLGTIIGIVVGALAMAVIGWNYHRMVSSDPGPGGAYSYTQKAIGADCGFLTAWSLSLAYMAILWANATALILLVRYMFGNVLQFGWHDNLAGFDIYLGEVLLSVVVMIIAGLPVYLFTAEVEMQDTYAENGFNDILLKPANLEALKKLLA